jgi:hypothetical protein
MLSVKLGLAHGKALASEEGKVVGTGQLAAVCGGGKKLSIWAEKSFGRPEIQGNFYRVGKAVFWRTFLC